MALSFLRRCFSRRDPRPVKTNQDQTNSEQAEAQFCLGLNFANGVGSAQDYPQAAVCYARAAAQNHSLAQFNLAMMYAQGQGVARDEATSWMWMTRAAELGDAGAQYRLGLHQHLILRHAPELGLPEMRIEALKWVRLSAAQGYRAAEGASEFLALGMTLAEVAEGRRRQAAFVPHECHLANSAAN